MTEALGWVDETKIMTTFSGTWEQILARTEDADYEPLLPIKRRLRGRHVRRS
jgi:hypothetical protein